MSNIEKALARFRDQVMIQLQTKTGWGRNEIYTELRVAEMKVAGEFKEPEKVIEPVGRVLYSDLLPTLEEALAFNSLCNKIHLLNKKWWVDLETEEPKVRNIGELLMLVTTELAEAMEGHRKSLKDDKLPEYDMFDVECIDAVVRLFDILGALVEDPAQILTEKLHYNANRADHKLENRRLPGGKKV